MKSSIEHKRNTRSRQKCSTHLNFEGVRIAAVFPASHVGPDSRIVSATREMTLAHVQADGIGSHSAATLPFQLAE
jgi:hypothetical protein